MAAFTSHAGPVSWSRHLGAIGLLVPGTVSVCGCLGQVLHDLDGDHLALLRIATAVRVTAQHRVLARPAYADPTLPRSVSERN
jgi:hypothetical protein